MNKINITEIYFSKKNKKILLKGTMETYKNIGLCEILNVVTTKVVPFEYSIEALEGDVYSPYIGVAVALATLTYGSKAQFRKIRGPVSIEDAALLVASQTFGSYDKFVSFVNSFILKQLENENVKKEKDKALKAKKTIAKKEAEKKRKEAEADEARLALALKKFLSNPEITETTIK